MSLVNIGLILLSSLSHALWNVLTQTSQNSRYFSGLKGLWIIAMGLISLLVFDFQWNQSDLLFWAVLSGILHGVYILCLSRAYSNQDISYVYPIARSAPAFVPFLAFYFLGEKLNAYTFLAIAVILLAIYILHFKGHLIEGFKNLWDAVLHKDLRWAFYTLALVVAYSLVDKRGMDVFFAHFPDQAFANGIIFFFLESLVGFSLYLVYLFRVESARDIFPVWQQEWKKALVAGVATLGSYGLICVVLQFEAVSAVVSLRQTSVLMVVYWGCWKLGEPFGKQRVLAAGLMVLGIGLLGWNP
ncbi:MAG: membrane protein [Nitrospinaceae bacterium]|nr:MAG: membrane protein [Nitrospinaceae bacterium]